MIVLNKYLSKFIDLVGLLCSICLLLMIGMVFYNVVARYVFNSVDIGLQELEWHFFSAMFLFGIGYTLKEDAHVRVDVIYDHFGSVYKAWVNILGNLLFVIPFSCLVAYYGYSYALDAYQIGEGSGDPGGLPHRWIVRSFISASSLFVILCSTQVIARNIGLLRRGAMVSEESDT